MNYISQTSSMSQNNLKILYFISRAVHFHDLDFSANSLMSLEERFNLDGVIFGHVGELQRSIDARRVFTALPSKQVASTYQSTLSALLSCVFPETVGKSRNDSLERFITGVDHPCSVLLNGFVQSFI